MPTLQLIPVPCNTPVIELTISGAKHKFIIDTGSTTSIISVELALTKKWTMQQVCQMSGITTDMMEVLRIDIRFNFLQVSIPSIVIHKNMDIIKATLPFRISGLIGQDILSQFSQVCFDYKNKVVRFGV